MSRGSFYDGNIGEETIASTSANSSAEATASAAAAAASAAAALVSEGLADADATSAAASIATTAANVVSTNADVVLTAADVVTTNLDVAATNADVILTGVDAASTAADVILTAADVVSAEADKVQTGLDRIAVAADLVATNQDTIDTAADVVLTAADVVLTNADVLSAEDSQLEANDWANRAEDLLTRTFLNGVGTNRAAGNYSTLHWEAKTSADEALTNADAIATAADLVATNQDTIDTAADLVLTNADAAATAADRIATAADAVLTAADVVSSAANAASAASVYDGFDDRYLGSKAVAPTLDNDGDALVVGALYFDTVLQSMQVNTASGWIATSSATLATMERFVFTASAAQTIFTGLDDSGTDTLAIVVGAEMVTLNGIVLEVTTDYTVSTTTITLTTAAAVNDELNVYAFGNFEIANHYTKAAADARFLGLAGGALTGAVTTTSTFDGVDIATRDGILTTTTATADAALPKVGGAMTGAITTTSTFDGRDVATDGTKLDGVEALADVTDTINVTAAGALMDSEVTNLVAVKAFATTDYATAAQGTTADAALPKAGGALTGAVTTTSTIDGVDIATRDGILTTTTTTANAALPKAGGAMTGNITHADGVKATYGTGADLEIYHNGSNSFISDVGTGNLKLVGTNVDVEDAAGFNMVTMTADGAVDIYYNHAKKIETTANGLTVTGTAVATTSTDVTNTGSVTLDFAANQNFVLTLTGAVTLANPTTEQVGQSGFIAFIQDATGGRTVALGTDYETAASAGLTLTATASATDLVPYIVVASGRILLGTPQLAFG